MRLLWRGWVGCFRYTTWHGICRRRRRCRRRPPPPASEYLCRLVVAKVGWVLGAQPDMAVLLNFSNSPSRNPSKPSRCRNDNVDATLHCFKFETNAQMDKSTNQWMLQKRTGCAPGMKYKLPDLVPSLETISFLVPFDSVKHPQSFMFFFQHL